MKHIVLISRRVLCVIVVILALELCARLDDVLSYDAPFWGPYNNEILLKTDSLGRWGKPGARYEKWKLNNLGYRGPELKPATVRIVCFGASETFGLYEAPDEEYPRQLERDLNHLVGRPEFQVVNAAFPGETLPTAILRVPQVVSEIHPSYALIYTPPANYIDMKSESVESANLKQRATQSDRIFQLRISERISNLLKSALPKVIQTDLREFQIKRATSHVVVMKTLPQKNVERYQQDLVSMIDALRAHGVEPILVTHATEFGLSNSPQDRDLLTEWRKFYPTLDENGFMDMERRMSQVTRETAIRENLTLIDAANEMPPGPENFADMVHFTTKGAGVMASVLAAGLAPVLFSQAVGTASRPSPEKSTERGGCSSSHGFATGNR